MSNNEKCVKCSGSGVESYFDHGAASFGEEAVEAVKCNDCDGFGVRKATDKMAVHFSSTTDLWATPQAFFDKYNSKFNFATDVCANAENAKCATFYDKEADGLGQDWKGACWMNPPYGRGIGAWVKKAYESAQQGATVVCLLPARTDTAWWHDYCAKGEVEFIRGRLKFGGHKNSAPFPSAVVIFSPVQKCGGDGIGNTSCIAPMHLTQHSGVTYCDWKCANCQGSGRSTWD